MVENNHLTLLPSLMATAVFSGLSANLILQCGFDLKEIALDGEPDRKKMFSGLGCVCISIIALWLVFSLVRSILPMGLMEYMLLFPVSCVAFSFIDYLFNRYVLRKTSFSKKTETKQFLREGGLTAAALFITLNIASGFMEAAVAAIGFTLGVAVTFLIIGEIRRRCSMESVPRFFKGVPLVLITAGLLSLVFSSAAMMFYKILEG